jgi:hypothetical protein
MGKIVHLCFLFPTLGTSWLPFPTGVIVSHLDRPFVHSFSTWLEIAGCGITFWHSEVAVAGEILVECE